MTPEEIAAQSGEIERALSELGVTPQAALLAEGRQAAWARLGNAHRQAAERGQADRVAALESRIEQDAAIHARRQMARLGIRAAAGERAPTQALPAATSQPPATLGGTNGGPPQNAAEAFVEDTPGSALGIDWGAPRPAFAGSPSLPAAAANLPDWYRRGRVSEGMVARPLMPQSAVEENDQAANNAALGQAYQTGVDASTLIAGGPVMGAAESAVLGAARGIGNLAARVPRTTAAVAGATALTAGASEAGPPDPVQSANSELTTLRTTRKTLAEEIGQLEALARNPNRAGVQGMQRTLGLNPDGIWGDQTRAAFERYKAAKLEEQRKNGEAITRAETRLSQAERAQRREQALEGLMPWERFVVERPGLVNTAALIAGGSLPSAARSVWSAGGAALTRWNRNRMILGPSAPTEARVASANRFYSEGGGQEPFRIDPSAPQGFVPAPRQQSGANLFPEPPRPGYRAGDAVATVIPAGIAARAGYQYFGEAKKELEDARNAADANPSKENMDRLAQAEYRATMTGATFSGAAGATLGTAAYPLMRPQFSTRPNVQRAGAEVQQLNALSRQPPRNNNGPWPTLEERRRDRNFRLPENAPVNPADVPAASTGTTGEVWVSPAGNKTVTRRSNGTWSEPGVRGSAKPPQERRGWRRIAGVEDIMFGGYPPPESVG